MSFKMTGGFDELAKELDELGNLDQYAPKMLEAAAPILQKELQQRVKAEANRGYATGDLKNSIQALKPGLNEQGHYVAVSAVGKDRKGIRNNEKLAYLEYGTSRQQARPVIEKSTKSAEKECLEAMQSVFDEVNG